MILMLLTDGRWFVFDKNTLEGVANGNDYILDDPKTKYPNAEAMAAIEGELGAKILLDECGEYLRRRLN